MNRTVANKISISRRVSMGSTGGGAVADATSTDSGAFERPFGDIVLCMCVCNKASISVNDDGANFRRVQTNVNIEELEKARTNEVETLNIIGNPSEAAMLRYVVELSDAQILRARYDVVFEVRRSFCSEKLFSEKNNSSKFVIPGTVQFHT
jgi:hypothetical protein